MAISFKGAAKRLDDIDLPRLGATIGVGEDEIHAFMDVEAAGSGFDSQGRPKMLFEPHVFYRNLQGEKRERAVKAGLAYPSWKRNYPADSYPRLLAAIEIDETAALKASSWGLGQILGENHKLVGYGTPQAMVRAFVDDEEAHLEAIIAFLKGKGLDKHLRAHNWAKVAEGYNGAQYAKNGYHTKMRAAFAKWQGIRDTPWPPAAPAEPAKPVPLGGVIYPPAVGGGDQSAMGNPIAEQNQSLEAVTATASKMEVVQPARSDGKHEAPVSELSFWHAVKRLFGL